MLGRWAQGPNETNFRVTFLRKKRFTLPKTCTGQLFEKNDFAHLIDDQEVFGLHFFNKNYNFELPEKGSFYEWLIESNKFASF